MTLKQRWYAGPRGAPGLASEEIHQKLKELHDSYLKNNPYDEGDPIFYRINYRLAESFALSKEQAASYHELYHKENPRRISEGYCNSCGRVVGIIPIIYGVNESEMERMKAAESEGRLIIGSAMVKSGKMAMFGCKVCRTPLPKYGAC